MALLRIDRVRNPAKILVKTIPKYAYQPIDSPRNPMAIGAIDVRKRSAIAIIAPNGFPKARH